MAIEFACPNGHRLSSPDNYAGKLAKCPKCGAIAKVPAAHENDASPAPAATGSDKPAGAAATGGAKVGADKAGGSGKGIDSGKHPAGKPAAEAPAGAAASGGGEPAGDAPRTPETPQSAPQPSGASGPKLAAQAAAAAPAEKPAAEEQIVFLCPNGHKVNAPRSWQGRAGQCRECGAKFRIPILDEGAGELDEPSDLAEPGEDFGNFGQLGGAGTEFELDDVELPEAPDYDEEEEFPAEPGHPLAKLVTRLWSEREQGGIIELHLSGGAMLVPEWFEKRLSQQSHGLFATQAADGTVTMMVVPWESVLRVVVRGVVGLPDGMFE